MRTRDGCVCGPQGERQGDGIPHRPRALAVGEDGRGQGPVDTKLRAPLRASDLDYGHQRSDVCVAKLASAAHQRKNTRVTMTKTGIRMDTL